MAEDAPEKTHPATPVVTLYILLLFLTLLTGLLSGFYSYIGDKFGLGVEILPFGAGISLGDEVVTLGFTEVFDEPGDLFPAFSVPAGTLGEVIDGPIIVDGVTWWKVKFENGSVGWVKDGDLAPSEVITNSETSVYSEPGGIGFLGTVPKGTLGKIIDGPRTIGGVRWWKVEFEDGTTGWVNEASLGSPGKSGLSQTLTKFVSGLKVFSTFASLIFLTLFVYSYIRFRQVKAEEDYRVTHNYEPEEGDFAKNDRWEKITTMVNSDNPSDWKQAIIDADVILDELVTGKGYQGTHLGDKMKNIKNEDLATRQSAWDAHKVRNRIAHDGGNFVLTQHEAKRVINLFAAVFREMRFL